MRVAPMTSRFLDACRRRPTDVRPVWFMRQAGRYLKQYRDIRAHHGILEICKRPDLAAAVTLQPVEILDVDAAIIFADLLLAGRADGAEAAVRRRRRARRSTTRFARRPISTRFRSPTPTISATSANRSSRWCKALAGRVPVIGFVGAPFTLASYMIEGGPSQDLPRNQADDVSRRDPVAPADGQARRCARLVRAAAGLRRRARHSGVR